ncbi:methyltransferase domain-containing protein [Nonomuraea terrae]|nr:methyltransferase domain-containing protein [Nonomuraea terrae]
MSAKESLARLLDDVDATPEATALRARSYDLLALPDGAAVVDVGCGAGRAVGELAARGARAIGVDVSAEMIALARSRGPESDLRIGDARALPLADGEVAGYRADKVFHELPDPAEPLEEARRVLAPDGRIVLLGQDWDGFIVDSADPALTRAIVHARADAVTNPWAARRFRNLLLDTGFTNVTVEAHTGVLTGGVVLPMLTGLAAGARAAGAISPEQEAAWTAEQRERARTGRAFLALPMFVAAARRP